MRRVHAPTLVLLAATLPSCLCGRIGTVPLALVEFHDRAASDGRLGIRIDRDGEILQMAADIGIAELPEAVRAAALERLPGANITGAALEIHCDGEHFGVRASHEGRAWRLVMDADGNLRSSEKELRRDEAPTAVLDTADRAVAGGTFESVALVEGGENGFCVKKVKDGVRYEIALAPDGTLLHAVRRARAEIGIPLRD